ncbi:MAG: hypothetical protein ACREIC_12565, partial [Limisphaerales bacterium]
PEMPRNPPKLSKLNQAVAFGSEPRLPERVPQVKASNPITFEPRLRIRIRDEVALGPGKAELLRRLSESG